MKRFILVLIGVAFAVFSLFAAPILGHYPAVVLGAF